MFSRTRCVMLVVLVLCTVRSQVAEDAEAGGSVQHPECQSDVDGKSRDLQKGWRLPFRSSHVYLAVCVRR